MLPHTEGGDLLCGSQQEASSRTLAALLGPQGDKVPRSDLTRLRAPCLPGHCPLVLSASDSPQRAT